MADDETVQRYLAEATSIESWKRRRVAQDVSTPCDLLYRLSRDADPAVRMAVLNNPCCPPEVLQAAAHSIDLAVRQTAIGHAACPPRVLKWAITYKDETVRIAAARNPMLSDSALGRLAEDPDLDVRAVASSQVEKRRAARRSNNW